MAGATELLLPLKGPLIEQLRACALDQSLGESAHAMWLFGYALGMETLGLITGASALGELVQWAVVLYVLCMGFELIFWPIFNVFSPMRV